MACLGAFIGTRTHTCFRFGLHIQAVHEHPTFRRRSCHRRRRREYRRRHRRRRPRARLDASCTRRPGTRHRGRTNHSSPARGASGAPRPPPTTSRYVSLEMSGPDRRWGECSRLSRRAGLRANREGRRAGASRRRSRGRRHRCRDSSRIAAAIATAVVRQPAVPASSSWTPPWRHDPRAAPRSAPRASRPRSRHTRARGAERERRPRVQTQWASHSGRLNQLLAPGPQPSSARCRSSNSASNTAARCPGAAVRPQPEARRW